jgi:hypothetical protein
MRIYQLTSIGESEASSPSSEPSDARKVLYYLRKRSNGAASDDMISEMVFGGNKSQAQIALSKLVRVKAVTPLG